MKVMINIKFCTLLQNVVGGPARVNLLAENGNQVTAMSNLADRDY